MASTLQVIYDIKEVLKKYSDDTEYDNRHILYVCNLKRAKFLRQIFDDKTRNFENVLLQSLCLSFIEVNEGMCGIEAPCTIMRSTQPIPKLLEIRNRSTLVSIRPAVVISKSFKLIDFTQASYILDKPYSNGIYATIDSEGYIYLLSKNDEHRLITCLHITGIFEDPSELESYTNCCGCEQPTSCFEMDHEYPAQSFIIDQIRDEVIKLFIGTKERLTEDKDNNADDQ